MARMTVKALAADLEALRVERQALLAEVASLKAQLAQGAKLVAELSAPRPTYVRPVRSTDPSAFQLACQKARELAMRSGRSVEVA